MLDLDCKRDQALAEYQEALKVRDGQQDTRLAAERGAKAAYAINGHSCEEDDGDEAPAAGAPKPTGGKPGAGASGRMGLESRNNPRQAIAAAPLASNW